MRFFARFIRNEEAATAVEYSVMLALILMATFAAIGMVGVKTAGLWDLVTTNLHAMGH